MRKIWHPEGTCNPLPTGILPSQKIREFVDCGYITSPVSISDKQIQPASIDLRLSRKAYRVKASFLPGKSTIQGKLRDLLINEIDLEHHTLFPRGDVFIVELVESLALPKDVSGKANPKSTTGRLDIFTRLIPEGGSEFESVPKGYRGKLYLEIVSRTFPIIIRAGMTLNQLRLVKGDPPSSDGRLFKFAGMTLASPAPPSDSAPRCCSAQLGASEVTEILRRYVANWERKSCNCSFSEP